MNYFSNHASTPKLDVFQFLWNSLLHHQQKSIIWYLLPTLSITIRLGLHPSITWSILTEESHILWLSFSTTVSGWYSNHFSFTLKPNLQNTSQPNHVIAYTLSVSTSDIHLICHKLARKEYKWQYDDLLLYSWRQLRWGAEKFSAQPTLTR